MYVCMYVCMYVYIYIYIYIYTHEPLITDVHVGLGFRREFLALCQCESRPWAQQLR